MQKINKVEDVNTTEAVNYEDKFNEVKKELEEKDKQYQQVTEAWKAAYNKLLQLYAELLDKYTMGR